MEKKWPHCYNNKFAGIKKNRQPTGLHIATSFSLGRHNLRRRFYVPDSLGRCLFRVGIFTSPVAGNWDARVN